MSAPHRLGYLVPSNGCASKRTVKTKAVDTRTTPHFKPCRQLPPHVLPGQKVFSIDEQKRRLASNLRQVQERIALAAERDGRRAEEVKLVAVTKYVDEETTRLLFDAGQTVLGESRPQSLWNKAEFLGDCGVEWHLVGHLQRNKVQRTLPYCHLIHSVDSSRLMGAIAEAAAAQGRTAQILLEVHISSDRTKQGFQPEELPAALDEASGLSHVAIRGFMAMGSLGGDDSTHRREFARLRELREQLARFNGSNVSLDELSMGMSNDFELAIAEGATIVRVGSLIFE
jgi:hypothetical protein